MLPLPPWLDCSPQAQDLRLKQLASLQAKLRLGVSSISDRGRSEAFRPAPDMQREIDKLKAEIVACVNGCVPGKHRLSYIDLVKGI